MRVEDQWPFEDPTKLQLFSMSTPNGVKVSAALEELGLPYEPHLIHIGKGDQHHEAYLTLSPNGKIPAIVDPDGPGGERLELMESGAILLHLAEKTGKLMPTDAKGRLETLQWVFFQVGHVGPMFGQFGHFYKFAKDEVKDPYPLERYTQETARLMKVMERRLADGRTFLMGDGITIADFAIVPWIEGLVGFYEGGAAVGYGDLEHVPAYHRRVVERPSYQRGMKVNAPG